jgi:hypothetical protein
VKEQDYQVQVRVLECRQLAGTQLDPVCTVTVGNQKKHTAVKEQTNCPYWDEVHDNYLASRALLLHLKFLMIRFVSSSSFLISKCRHLSCLTRL